MKLNNFLLLLLSILYNKPFIQSEACSSDLISEVSLTEFNKESTRRCTTCKTSFPSQNNPTSEYFSPNTLQNARESRFALSNTMKDHLEAEKKVALNRRLAAAYISTILPTKNTIENQNNGDEATVSKFAAQFSKTFEHNFETGLLTDSGARSYSQLVQAMSSGQQADFNAIVRTPEATGKLVNPQAGLAFSLEGADSCLFNIALFPPINSAHAAALLIEDYLMALDRDVLFSEYGTGIGTDANGSGGSLTNDAAAVLRDLGADYTGPLNSSGLVDTSVLFRGSYYGSLIGPYISQFLYLPIKTPGAPKIDSTLFIKVDQQYPIAHSREFGISFKDFVTIQNGNIPKPYNSADFNGKRYIVTGRDLASYVHFDNPYEAYYNAISILASHNFPLSSYLPYRNGTITNEAPFATLGVPDAFAMIGDVTAEAFKAAWAQKWRTQRVLRPEAFAGLVQQAKASGTNPVNLHQSLFVPHAGIDMLANIKAKNILQASFSANMLTSSEAATYLLAQVYPEGSPAHPSYPAGHAAVAGACITIIKAIFDDTALIHNFVSPVVPNPAQPTQLIPLLGNDETIITVASELDKLAFNIALGRDWAGVHYRWDGLQGIILGEQVAIEYLREQACKYAEQTFQGFIVTKVDGTRIRINANGVFELGSIFEN